MKNEIVFSPDALADLEGIKIYISDVLSNPIAAQRIVEKIVRETDRLSGSPEIGPKFSSKFGINTEYRFLVVENYLIIYVIEDESVRIIRVFDGRQDYLRFLFSVSSH